MELRYFDSFTSIFSWEMPRVGRIDGPGEFVGIEQYTTKRVLQRTLWPEEGLSLRWFGCLGKKLHSDYRFSIGECLVRPFHTSPKFRATTVMTARVIRIRSFGHETVV